MAVALTLIALTGEIGSAAYSLLGMRIEGVLYGNSSGHSTLSL